MNDHTHLASLPRAAFSSDFFAGSCGLASLSEASDVELRGIACLFWVPKTGKKPT